MTDPDLKSRSLTEADKAEVRSTYEALQKHIPGFRRRGAQLHMIAAASRAFGRANGVAVVEAGTGTGKSLAYMTAGYPIARNHGLKLVISTGTIALQEQLVNRDIPLFLGATKDPARVVLAKGRQRYVCLRNLVDMTSDSSDTGDNLFGEAGDGAWPRPPAPGEVQALSSLVELIEKGDWSGDLDTTPIPIAEDLRSAMVTSSGACENHRCPFFDQCAFFRARGALEEADVVVVNHALLLSDLRLTKEDGSTGGVLLPDPGQSLYVIDEGHHLAPVARDATAAYGHVAGIQKRLPRIRIALQAAMKASGRNAFDLQSGLKLMSDIDSDLSHVSKMVKQSWVPESSQERDRGQDGPMWLAPLGVVPEEWRQHAFSLGFQFGKLIDWIKAVRFAIGNDDGIKQQTKQKLLRELGEAVESLRGQMNLWTLWGRKDESGSVPAARWITLTKGDRSFAFHACEVSSAAFLASHLFAPAAGVLITSATLTGGGDFTPLRRDLGLPPNAETLALPSPFNLRDQGTLRVPGLRALPGDREAHSIEVAQWLESKLDWSAGNLVLFTAQTRMEAVFNALSESRRGFVRMQNTAPKAQLISDHCSAIEQGVGSTLFGLASFGEGLDLKGRLCSRVVITSLPFQVPTEPVAQTFSAWIEQSGGNSFVEVSVPEAMRVLTQYCGRLIRHEDDSGEIVILDRRLADKGYGRRMLKALPPFRQVIEPVGV